MAATPSTRVCSSRIYIYGCGFADEVYEGGAETLASISKPARARLFGKSET